MNITTNIQIINIITKKKLITLYIKLSSFFIEFESFNIKISKRVSDFAKSCPYPNRTNKYSIIRSNKISQKFQLTD